MDVDYKFEKKIAFVTPWYGENIPGGAEAELRGLVKHLSKAGVELEILTTCAQQFLSDWSEDYYNPGIYDVNGIVVRRFKLRKRDTVSFDRINIKLMNNQSISAEEEEVFVREMVNSPDLYEYISDNKDEYALFVYIPYMFGTTYYGILACPQKSVMIPCFHDESYIYMNIYKKAFEQARGMAFLAHSEQLLAQRVFNLRGVKGDTLGAGVDTEFDCNAKDFRDKFGIKDPFILYAGRKDVGKNVDILVEYFSKYVMHRNSNLKLVLIGGGNIYISEQLQGKIIDLGFVDVKDKYNAYAAANVMCNPSTHESFSIVIMESWLSRRPVIVHEKCEVTKDFVRATNGGLYFNDYYEFECCIDYLITHPDIADEMGRNGRKYVLKNFSWDVIVKKYCDFFREIIEKGEGK